MKVEKAVLNYVSLFLENSQQNNLVEGKNLYKYFQSLQIWEIIKTLEWILFMREYSGILNLEY